MKFKNFQLIIDDNMPKIDDLQKIAQNGLLFIKDFGSDWYEVEKSFEEERFLWLYCEYDNATIYNENILDGEKDEKQRNPRKKLQVELRKQLFICYDANKKLLYMNDIEKRGFVKHYFSDTLQKTTYIKNIYASLDDFQNSVKTIKQLKFVQEKSIVNLEPTSIFQRQANIFGLDMPEKITMQVEYGNTPIGSVLKRLQEFEKWKNRGDFESIILVGVNDSSVEESFDFSSIIKAIEVKASKTENGRYDPEFVKSEFLKKIR